LKIKAEISKQMQKPHQCPRQERGLALQVKPTLERRSRAGRKAAQGAARAFDI